MFEKEIKFIIDFTLNRISKLGSVFTYEKLTTAGLHPAIILYISAELDYLIYEDRKKLLQKSSFDYSGSEISRYFRLISEEIKKNKRLSFEDVKILVTNAVTFNMNYLIKPNRTLSQLIFSDEKTRSVNEIKMMLNYLYYYDYVKNVFLGYFSRRKILSLNETEFNMILGKVDHQMFSERTGDLIDNALVSISEFFNEGGVNKTRITAPAVESFLKEKNLMEALFKLRRSIPAEDKRKYDIEEIRKILYSKEPVKTEPVEEDNKEIPEEKVTDQGTEAEEVHEEAGDEQDFIEEEIVMDDPETKDDSEDILSETEDDSEDILSETEDDSEDILSKTEDEFEDILSETEDESEDILSETEEIPDADNFEAGAEEEINKSGAEDDFISRYETELKSLEELEAQLRHLGIEENLAPDEPFEEEEIEDIEEVEQKEIQAEKKLPEVEDIIPEQSGPVDDFDEEDNEPSDELIFEEEEVNPFGENNKDIVEEKTTPPLKKARDILSFLSDKEMEKIVSTVFNEDEEDFANTMEKISESPGYDEATEILKAVFSSYKISPYSRDAVTLTNAVSNYFDQA